MSERQIGESQNLNVILSEECEEQEYQIWYEDLAILGMGKDFASAQCDAIRNLADFLKEITTLTVNHHLTPPEKKG